MIGIKAEYNQRLESFTNIRMKAKRYDSLWKESRAINSGIKIA